MNFVFVSPQFPHTYWQFCERLARRGVNVLGVGDAPYDQLDPRLRACLAEYFRVDSLEDYDQVFRAVAFLSYRHGKIDWIESNNEHWLELDGRLRDDFNVTTGYSHAEVARLRSKARQKALYDAAGIAAPAQASASDPAACHALALRTGFPLFAKPEFGVGADGAYALHDEKDLDVLLATRSQTGGNPDAGGTPYVVEQFVRGQIVSYDAILDAGCNPLFESSCAFPSSMADVANGGLDLAYSCLPTIDPLLRARGRAVAKAAGARNRFVHFEFFRLDEASASLGAAGDYVGLELNLRPCGGYTPDMMNFSHSCDVYQIWADMVCGARGSLGLADCDYGRGCGRDRDCRRDCDHDCGSDRHFCTYASRRDGVAYAHSHDEVVSRYGHDLVMSERMPDALSDDMGNHMYTARLATSRESAAFVDFVCQRA